MKCSSLLCIQSNLPHWHSGLIESCRSVCVAGWLRVAGRLGLRVGWELRVGWGCGLARVSGWLVLRIGWCCGLVWVAGWLGLQVGWGCRVDQLESTGQETQTSRVQTSDRDRKETWIPPTLPQVKNDVPTHYRNSIIMPAYVYYYFTPITTTSLTAPYPVKTTTTTTKNPRRCMTA